MSDSLSLYIHIPFCRRRCGYCDFNTYAGMESIIPDYITALCLELAYHHQVYDLMLPVKTIYFGGGTPSLIPVRQINRIFECLDANFILSGDIEISMEANPGTLSLNYLKEIHSAGVNRLSLGVQSFHPEELRLLDRQHVPGDVFQAVTWARQSGFENLSLDLIFGLPDQELRSWQQSLISALELSPQHLSLYALSVEEGTPLASWIEHGICNPPDEDSAADMMEWTIDHLESSSLRQYEISNWALQEQNGRFFTCQHNLQYWRNKPYLGFGAGAHGYAGGKRTSNILTPEGYISRMINLNTKNLVFPATPSTISIQNIDRPSEIGETMMMGLRLVEEGVSEDLFLQRFEVELAEYFQPQIDQLTASGLIEWGYFQDQRVLRLTRAGRLLGNQVFMEFI